MKPNQALFLFLLACACDARRSDAPVPATTVEVPAAPVVADDARAAEPRPEAASEPAADGAQPAAAAAVEAPVVPAATVPPLTPELAAELARGRALLAAGRAAEAQPVFEALSARDGDSLRTRVWVIRSWIDQGRINDSLDAIDALDKLPENRGPALDYLYGMAFVAKARDYIGRNVQGQIVQMSYVDAVGFLQRATETDPELYGDALFPLAEAAWQSQEPEIARAAVERALARDPANAEAALLAGKLALARFAEVKGDAEREADAEADWQAARAGFERVVELAAASAEPARRALAAQAYNQLGHTFLWKERRAEAAGAYGAAAALDPTSIDFTQLLGALGPESFLAALEKAAGAPAPASDAQSSADATVLWWLGYARFAQKQYEGAEAAFTAAVGKAPAFVNSWWYVALARYHRQNYAGAVEAIARNWDENPADLVASVTAGKEIAVPIVTYLVGWCAQQTEPLNAEAGMLCEVLANVEPAKSDHWNNAGLFWRDAGERLVRSGGAEEKARAKEHFEKAYAFYLHALEMEPDNPGFLNDTAVMLHYNLDRDLDRALAMYKQATARAEAELAKPDLDKDKREWFQIALRDSKNNTKLLEDELAKRKAEAEKPAAPPPAAEGGTPPKQG